MRPSAPPPLRQKQEWHDLLLATGLKYLPTAGGKQDERKCVN